MFKTNLFTNPETLLKRKIPENKNPEAARHSLMVISGALPWPWRYQRPRL